jgi:hypothetical protein
MSFTVPNYKMRMPVFIVYDTQCCNFTVHTLCVDAEIERQQRVRDRCEALCDRLGAPKHDALSCPFNQQRFKIVGGEFLM